MNPDNSTFCTGTEAAVCNDIAQRQAKGIAKYGTTVRDNPLTLRQWAQHAYEECLDMAVYLKRMMEEMDTVQARADEAKRKADKFLQGIGQKATDEALSFTKGPEPGSEPIFPQENGQEISQEMPECFGGFDPTFTGCYASCSIRKSCECTTRAKAQLKTGFRFARHTETGRLLELANRFPLPAGYAWADEPAKLKGKPEQKQNVATMHITRQKLVRVDDPDPDPLDMGKD